MIKRLNMVILVFIITISLTISSYMTARAQVIPFAIWTLEDVIASIAGACGISLAGYAGYNHDTIASDCKSLFESMKEYGKSEIVGTDETFDIWLDGVVTNAQETGSIIMERSSAGWKELKKYFAEITKPTLNSGSFTVNSQFVTAVNQYTRIALNSSDTQWVQDYCSGYTDCIIYVQNRVGSRQSEYGWYYSYYDREVYFVPFNKIGNSVDLNLGTGGLTGISSGKAWGKITQRFSSLTDNSTLTNEYTQTMSNGFVLTSLDDVLYSTCLVNGKSFVKPSAYAPTTVGKIGVRDGFDTLIQDDSYVDNYDIITPGNTVTRDDTGVVTVTGDIAIPVDHVSDDADVINPPNDDVIPYDRTDGNAIPDDTPVETTRTPTGDTDDPTDDTVEETTNKTVSIGSKLKTLFPFCIPFDLISAVKVLKATPVEPKWQWTLKIDKINFQYTFNLDFSKVQVLVTIFRYGMLLLFIIGLILLTRNIIRG